MGRRNPANPRYQRGAEVGKTRRSAASAKPKRGAGDTAPASKKPKKKRSKLLAPVPTDPAYRQLRKIWLALLGAAIVLSALAWWQQETNVGNVALALAYGCIFAAFYIDFGKMRKMRKTAIEADKAARSEEKGGSKKGSGGGSKKDSASDSDS